jgi:hypothetical protein
MTGLFAAICLLAVTQLSLVNLWYRTQSRKDFQGQYRVWIWSSLTWAVLFSAAISGWHLSLCDWLAMRFPGRLRPVIEKSWLLAATIMIATSLRLLAREVGRAAAPRWLMAGAACIGSINAFLRLQAGFLPAEVVTDLSNACGCLWPLLLASALLHHARYVIHVSNEALPLTAKVGRLSPVVQQVWAEVLQLGPSKATLTRSLAPRNVWMLVLKGARSASALSGILWKVIQSRLLNRRVRPEGNRGTRRKNSAPLPVAASSVDSQPRLAKSAVKSAKSA